MSKDPGELQQAGSPQLHTFKKRPFGGALTADVEDVVPDLNADNEPSAAVKGASWMAAMRRNQDIKENIASGVNLSPGPEKVSEARHIHFWRIVVCSPCNSKPVSTILRRCKALLYLPDDTIAMFCAAQTYPQALECQHACHCWPQQVAHKLLSCCFKLRGLPRCSCHFP